MRARKGTNQRGMMLLDVVIGASLLAAAGLAAAQMVLDTTSLRRLIAWIAEVRGMGLEGYRVRLLCAAIPWQERTLPMLRALALGLVTVEGLPA